MPKKVWFVAAVLVAVVSAANVVHWRLRRDSRYVYWPAGTLAAVTNALVVWVSLCTILSIAGRVPYGVWLASPCVLIMIPDVYSICRRRAIARGAAVPAD